MPPPQEEDVHKHFAPVAPDQSRKSERVQCKFCHKTMTKHVSRMRIHLTKCPQAAVPLMQHIKEPRASKQPRSNQSHCNTVSNLGNEISRQVNDKNVPLSTAFTAALEALSEPPRKGHVMQQMHEKMALVVYMEGLAFDFWTRPDVMDVVSLLRPGMVIDERKHFLPDGDAVAGDLLQTTKVQVMLRVIHSFAGKRGQAVGMSMANCRSINNHSNNNAISVGHQNVMICTPTPFLFNTTFRPTHGESPAQLLENIKEQVASFDAHFNATISNDISAASSSTTSSSPPPQLIGFVTNNRKNTKHMRVMADTNLTLAERNVIVYGCANEALYAHLSDVCGFQGGGDIPHVLEAIGRVVRFFADTKHADDFLGYSHANTGDTAGLFFDSELIDMRSDVGAEQTNEQAKWTHVLRIIQTLLFNKDALRRVAFDDSLRQNDPPFPPSFRDNPQQKRNKRGQKRRQSAGGANRKQPRLDVISTVAAAGDNHANTTLALEGDSNRIDAALAVTVPGTTATETTASQTQQEEHYLNVCSVKELLLDGADVFWRNMDALNGFLQPVFLAIQVLQHDLMPLSMVPACFLMLHRSYLEFIAKFPEKAEMLRLNGKNMEHAHESLHRRWMEITAHSLDADQDSKIANLMCLALLLDPATAHVVFANDRAVQLGKLGVVAAAQTGMDMLCQSEMIGDYTNLFTKHIDVTIPKLDGIENQPGRELLHPLSYYGLMASPLKPVVDIVFNLPCCAISGEHALNSMAGRLDTSTLRGGQPNLIERDSAVVKFNTMQLRRTQQQQKNKGIGGFASFERPRELMVAIHSADCTLFSFVGRSKPLSSLWSGASSNDDYATFLELPDWREEHMLSHQQVEDEEDETTNNEHHNGIETDAVLLVDQEPQLVGVDGDVEGTQLRMASSSVDHNSNTSISHLSTVATSSTVSLEVSEHTNSGGVESQSVESSVEH